MAYARIHKKCDCGEWQWKDASSSRCLAWRQRRCRQRAQAEPAHAPDSIAGRLVGTWSFASSVNTRKDGSTFDRWGANPSGIFMFDRGGNYAQIIVGSESRVFGAKTFCAFGTYSVEDAEEDFSSRASSRCSAAKLIGTSQNRDHRVADGG